MARRKHSQYSTDLGVEKDSICSRIKVKFDHWDLIKLKILYIDKQSKTILSIHFTQFRMAKIKRTNKQSKQHGKKQILIHCWKDCKLWLSDWRIFKKLKVNLPYDPAIPLLGICPKGSTPYSQILAQPCSLLLYSQKLGKQNNLNVFPLMNG